MHIYKTDSLEMKPRNMAGFFMPEHFFKNTHSHNKTQQMKIMLNGKQ